MKAAFLFLGIPALIFSQATGLTLEQVINIHPAIGDTLDHEENLKYRILFMTRPLERAVFYKEDSLVYARIWYRLLFKTRTRVQSMGTASEFSRMVADKVRKYEEKTEIQKQLPWINAFYMAPGVGTPNGFRLDVGTNYRHWGLGLTFIYGDNWSSPPDVMAGAYVLYHFIVLPSRITPFARFNLGGDIVTFFGADLISRAGFLADEYTSLTLGIVSPVMSRLHFRFESGIYYTSKYISGGTTFLTRVNQGPVVKENRTRMGFNLGFEYDLWRVK
jgi:hypothetical protein